MEPVSAWVPGKAVTLTTSGKAADEWKRSVARTVEMVWPGGYLNEPCRVHMGFSLASDRFWMTAVFNLLKATIDGLSHTVFRPSSSGQPGPWSREDFWISQLSATKALASDGPGVTIEVGPPRKDLPDRSGEPLVRTFVPGSPPVWPASEAAQRKVEAWRERLRSALGASSSEYAGTPIEVHLRFQIEAERMRSADLDNFCVPAAQGIASVLAGNLVSGGIIRKLRAEKEVAEDRKLGVALTVYALDEDGDV